MNTYNITINLPSNAASAEQAPAVTDWGFRPAAPTVAETGSAERNNELVGELKEANFKRREMEKTIELLAATLDTHPDHLIARADHLNGALNEAVSELDHHRDRANAVESTLAKLAAVFDLEGYEQDDMVARMADMWDTHTKDSQEYRAKLEEAKAEYERVRSELGDSEDARRKAQRSLSELELFMKGAKEAVNYSGPTIHLPAHLQLMAERLAELERTTAEPAPFQPFAPDTAVLITWEDKSEATGKVVQFDAEQNTYSVEYGEGSKAVLPARFISPLPANRQAAATEAAKVKRERKKRETPPEPPQAPAVEQAAPSTLQEVELASRHQGPLQAEAHIPSPSAPEAVIAAGRRIAEFKRLPLVLYKPGTAVTALTDECTLVTGSLERHYAGTSKWEVKLDKGGMLVVDADQIRGVASLSEAEAPAPADAPPPTVAPLQVGYAEGPTGIIAGTVQPGVATGFLVLTLKPGHQVQIEDWKVKPFPPSVTLEEYQAWQAERPANTLIDPHEYKRQRDAGLIEPVAV